MNSQNNNDQSLNIINIKKEAEEIIIEFTDNVLKRIEEISKMTPKDLDKLLKIILDDCQDLSELEGYTNILKNRIIQNELLIDKYLYQKDLSKKDIIDANLINFIFLYNGTYLVTRIISSNVYEFIKNFIITILIEIATFDFNLEYFTSDSHKKELDNNIKELYKAIDINQYDIFTFNKFHDLYIKELTYAVKKLLEITKYNSNDDNYKRIKKFLNGLKIDFLLEEEPIKTKIRKKDK